MLLNQDQTHYLNRYTTLDAHDHSDDLVNLGESKNPYQDVERPSHSRGGRRLTNLDRKKVAKSNLFSPNRLTEEA